MTTTSIFVSESVTEGHPDKLCDQVSDAIVDRCLRAEPLARINVECAISTGIVFIAAHALTEGSVELTDTTRKVIAAAGYKEGEFNARDCTILTSVNEREMPPGDGLVVTAASDERILGMAASDQVTAFGYACRQTPNLMPLPIALAHDLARRLDAARRDGEIAGVMPDAKTQVAVEYRGRVPRRVHSVSVVATGPATAKRLEPLREDVIEHVIRPALAAFDMKPDRAARLFVNPGGGIPLGGPMLHAGLTGRKTAIDTYGEYARHSGAALSGKDLLRIDRLAAYAARHAAKCVVAAGLAEECEIQLSYTIGLAEPVSLQADTRGTGKVDDEEIAARLRRELDFRPGAILGRFGLLPDPEAKHVGIFRPLAVYGHMGREDLGVAWEQTADAERLAG